MGDKVILISGCSTGIGRALATQLAEQGHTVVAGARDPGTLAGPAAASRGRLHPIAWDVTDGASTHDAVAKTIAVHGRIDVLINNAGYGQMGPIVELTREEWRRQLETNVIGLADATSKAARLPGGMIDRRSGRIVNISSILGRATIPWSGAYSATKYALESISDALRMELAPFGIDVVVVEPGPIATSFTENARRSLERIVARGDSPWESVRAYLEERTQPQPDRSMSAEACARIIARTAVMPRPPTRVVITALARMLLWMKRLLPDRTLDALLRSRSGLRAPAPPRRGARPPSDPAG